MVVWTYSKPIDDYLAVLAVVLAGDETHLSIFEDEEV